MSAEVPKRTAADILVCACEKAIPSPTYDDTYNFLGDTYNFSDNTYKFSFLKEAKSCPKKGAAYASIPT